jgi:signal transduction histidine kinase/FixJ family two-component response regulator
LWIEEFVTGDDVDLEKVHNNIADSVTMLDAIGIQADKTGWLLDLDEKTQVSQSVTIAKSELTKFKVISQQRLRGFEYGEDVGIGSSVDAQFDAVYGNLLSALNDLGQVYDLALKRNRLQSQQLDRAITTIWVLLVALAVGGLWHWENRRQGVETALHESEALLLQTQKMDAVGRLAGGIAHDINNHLAAMTMQCEVVKLRAPAGDPVIERMDAITAIGARSADLIRRLLAFSRRQPVKPEITSLPQIVADMQKMLTRLIGEDINLVVENRDDVWNVLIDPSQFEQIILNLVINARDAMPNGGQILVTMENCNFTAKANDYQDKPRGDYIAVTVADQGTGIPADIIDKIFEPFFTTKDVSGSSGLGLATVHGIVQQNHGYIDLSSTKNQVGAAFRILLPRVDEVPKSVAEKTQVNFARASCTANIMIIEDNEELCEGIQEILTQLGYTVSAISDSSKAMALFKQLESKLQLVITDVVMPGVGGKSLADEMQQRRPELPILFVSGYTDDVVLRHGVGAGEVNFLAKPFTAPVLAKTVETIPAKSNKSAHKTSKKIGTTAGFES